MGVAIISVTSPGRRIAQRVGFAVVSIYKETAQRMCLRSWDLVWQRIYTRWFTTMSCRVYIYIYEYIEIERESERYI